MNLKNKKNKNNNQNFYFLKILQKTKIEHCIPSFLTGIQVEFAEEIVIPDRSLLESTVALKLDTQNSNWTYSWSVSEVTNSYLTIQLEVANP